MMAEDVRYAETPIGRARQHQRAPELLAPVRAPA
jgi:hypothetical protein